MTDFIQKAKASVLILLNMLISNSDTALIKLTYSVSR